MYGIDTALGEGDLDYKFLPLEYNTDGIFVFKCNKLTNAEIESMNHMVKIFQEEINAKFPDLNSFSIVLNSDVELSFIPLGSVS